MPAAQSLTSRCTKHHAHNLREKHRRKDGFESLQSPRLGVRASKGQVGLQHGHLSGVGRDEREGGCKACASNRHLLRSLIFAYVRLYRSGSLRLSRCDMTKACCAALDRGCEDASDSLLVTEYGMPGWLWSRSHP